MVNIAMLAPLWSEHLTSKAFLQDFLATVEECGVESVWTVEHVVVADDYEPRYPYSADGRMPGGGRSRTPDPLELLSFCAASTTRLKLGTSVMIAPLHSPAVLAKRAATVDLLSDGRLLLGLGIGWQKEEYDAVGVPFSDRGRRLEEGIAAMRALWSQEPASYTGRYVSFSDVHLGSRPSGGRVPIVLAGNSEAAVRRAGRVGDGWFPYTISPSDFAQRAELLQASATEAGRSVDDIEITIWPGSYDFTSENDPDFVRQYVKAGASRVLISPQVTDGAGLRRLPDIITRYREDVLSRL